MKLVESRMGSLNHTSGLLENERVSYALAPFLIRRDGSWLYKGRLVTSQAMIGLLASLLTRDEHGRYMTDSGLVQGAVDVEDAPFVAVAMRWRGVGHRQALSFLTNTGQCIVAGSLNGLRAVYPPGGSKTELYLRVRDGKGAFPIEARVSRAVYYEVMALAEPGVINGREVLGIWSGGEFFLAANVPEDDA